MWVLIALKKGHGLTNKLSCLAVLWKDRSPALIAFHFDLSSLWISLPPPSGNGMSLTALITHRCGERAQVRKREDKRWNKRRNDRMTSQKPRSKDIKQKSMQWLSLTKACDHDLFVSIFNVLYSDDKVTLVAGFKTGWKGQNRWRLISRVDWKGWNYIHIYICASESTLSVTSVYFKPSI